MRNRLLLFIYLLFRKGGDNMLIRLFASEIIDGKITFADVPAKLKDGVRNYLKNLGLNEDGTPIVVEPIV